MRREVKAPARTIRPRERKPTERRAKRRNPVPALAKITPPAIPHAYRRTRLLGLLSEARRTHRMTWVAAPAGAGKTTLAVSYVASRKLPCLWYQLDAGDRDPASFFYYLGLAVAQVAPRFRRPLPKLTPEYLGAVEVFARNFFRELARRIRPPFVLVLDNMQKLPAGDRVYEVLREGLSELPRGAQVILLSRAEPPEAFARLRLNQQMAELGWGEMRLTEDELRPLVRVLRTAAPAFPLGKIESLYRRCNGWIAGLILLLDLAQRDPQAAEAFSAATSQRLFDYFAGEVFAQRPPAVQEFLMLTALFPDFTAEMAEGLTAYPRARALLDELVREHHFTERRAESADSYQYHGLFMEFLRARAEATWGTAQIARYRNRAARILEQAGQSEQALALYLEAGNSQAATGLILAHAQAWVAAGRFEALGTAIGRLSPPVVEQEPWLLYWRGVSRSLVNPAESAQYFARAYERFEERNERVGFFLAWSGAVDAIWQQQQDWSQLDPWIDRLEARLQRHEAFPSDDVAARVVSSLFWSLAWHRPTHPAMARWAEEAARLWERTEEFSIRLRLGVGLCTYYFLTGEAARFRALGESQLRLAGSKGILPDVALIAHMISIYVAVYGGLYQEASDRTRAAFDVAAAAGIHAFDCLLYGAALYPALGSEDVAAADALLARMGTILATQPTNLDASHYLMHCSWRARLAGDAQGAIRHARSAVEIASRIGAYYPEIMCRYGLAHAHLADGAVAGAQRENDAARAKAQAAGFNWWRYLCGLFDAYLAFERADEARGAKLLREALELQARFDIGYLLPSWSKAMIARLCVKAFAHDIATPYVRKLVRVHRLDVVDPPLRLETWPWQVKVYTLGRFTVLLDDKPLEFATKAQKKPLELLKALVALGGSNVREERLAEILWPDAEADSAAFALTTTVHRLRKLIGEATLERREGTLTLNPQRCWLDVGAVEEQLALIEQAARAGPPAALAERIERLFALYRGPFLADQPEESWVLAPRERLRGKFLRTMGQAANAFTSAHRYEQAIDCLEKGLEIDPLVESFYRGLMQAHLAQGHHAQALATYYRCRKTLAAHLGVEPSVDTEALRREITSP